MHFSDASRVQCALLPVGNTPERSFLRYAAILESVAAQVTRLAVASTRIGRRRLTRAL